MIHGPHPQAEAPQDDRTPSCLATALLLLWAHGGISATAVQHLALQAVLDGIHHQEVTDLAGLGTFGAHKGNIGRDLMRPMELEDIKISKPVAMSVPMRDTKTNRVRETVVHCYEPDLLLQGLAAYDELELQMRTDLVDGFWESLTRTTSSGCISPWSPACPLKMMTCAGRSPCFCMVTK